MRVLDIGAGVGVAGLCLLARVPGIELTAVEIDAGLCALAAENAARNGFGDKVRCRQCRRDRAGQIAPRRGALSESYRSADRQPALPCGGQVRAAPDRGRAAAHVMDQGGLAAWVRFFAAMAAPKALLTLIHRPDCLGELLPLLDGRFGDIAVFPLFPKQGEPATRIIVQAEKGSRAGLSLLPGLVLHRGGRAAIPAEAEAVLRGGEALDLRGRPKRRAAA